MGIRLDWGIPFLDDCYEKGFLKGPFAAIGQQESFDSVDVRTAFSEEHGYHNFYDHNGLGALLLDRYQISDYTDFDINGKSKIYLDFTEALPLEYKEKFHTLFDSGTMEHIFDQKTAFSNVYDMCSVGGFIIHVSPIACTSHGLFNYDQKTFHLIAKSNNYDIKVEGFVRVKYSNAPNKNGTMIQTMEEEYCQLTDRTLGLFDQERLKKDTCYVVVMQKTSNASFCVPYDT